MSESAIFKQALALSPESRADYLNQACGENLALRQEIESLLEAHDRSEGFLKETRTHRPITEQPGTIIGGKYKLMEQIGEGGFGLVFVAEQHEPVRRKVALKIIKPGMDSREVIARFEAERQALALMDHPNIARVLDAGATESGKPYFVMELVKGIPIHEYCDQQQLNARERLDLFMTVCQAVQHAHSKGVIHRDLKPSNILVAPHDGIPVVKVIDFGVAKAIGQQLTDKTIYTRFSQMIGTPLYMSPEQAEINALDVDIRSDVYSLGVLLYELLTGTTPIDRKRFATAAYDEIRRIIKEEEPPKPSTRLSTLGESLSKVSALRKSEPGKLSSLVKGDLDWIVMKALEKDRNRRYETASAFAADIRRFLTDEAIEARPPSIGYKLRKFVRRNRGPVLVGSALLLLLVLGLIGTGIGLVEAEQSANRARMAEAQAIEERQVAEQERDRAIKAEVKAKQEAAISQAVRQFLQNDLLSQANPWEQAQTIRSQGNQFEIKYNPTILEILDRAASNLTPEKIEAKFPNQPLVQAELLRVVGHSYGRLGELQKSKSHTSRSIELYESSSKRHSRVALSMRHEHAITLILSGERTEGIQKLRAVRNLQEATFGADDKDTLLSECELATFELVLHRKADCIARLQTAMNRAQKRYEPTEYIVAHATHRLAVGYQRTGRLTEAIQLLEELMNRLPKDLPIDHPDLLTGYMTLARFYSDANRIKEAIPIFERVLEGRKKAHGPNSDWSLRAMEDLIEAYQKNQQSDQALKVIQEMKSAFDQLKPIHPEDPTTLNIQTCLADQFRKLKRFDEAIPLFEDAIPRFRKVFGSIHPQTLDTIRKFALTFESKGAFAQAAERYEDVLKGHRAQPKPDPSTIAGNLEAVGRNLNLASRAPEAESILREALTIRERIEPKDWTTAATRASLGISFLLQKKFPEAEEYLLLGYQQMLERESTKPPWGDIRIRATRNRLAQLYTQLGKPEEAAKYRDKSKAKEKPQPKK